MEKLEGIKIDDLIKKSLLGKPDRIAVGEVKGEEVKEIFANFNPVCTTTTCMRDVEELERKIILKGEYGSGKIS